MNVVVVGGGLSGLFAAVELMAAGVDEVVVVDRAERPGGVARTISRNGFSLEAAVGAVNLPHPHLSPLLERIEVEMVAADPSANRRQVYVDGRLVTLPASPKALLAPILPWSAKLRALVEPIVPRGNGEDESLAAFCHRRFGNTAGEMIAWLMASGVFAGDPDRLSVRAAFPMLVDLEREHGSVIRGSLNRRRQRDEGPRPRLHYPAEGMSGLAVRAADFLGDRFVPGFDVESVSQDGETWVISGSDTLRADAVVLATAPNDAASIVDSDLGEHLGEAVSASVVVVGLGGPGRPPFPAGFGALVGPGEGVATRGILYESSYAPRRAPSGSWLLKVIADGCGLEQENVAGVVAEVETVLGASLAPTFTVAVESRIPQYGLGHTRWLQQLDALLSRRRGLHVTGWGYRGVGTAQVATDAVRVARELR